MPDITEEIPVVYTSEAHIVIKAAGDVGSWSVEGKAGTAAHKVACEMCSTYEAQEFE
jgi:tRNA A37 threonylcarbamoyladenosine dehydratase